MIQQISIPKDPDWPARMRARAHHNVTHFESCTQSILAAFMHELGIGNPMVLRAAGGMHGGMVSSLTCGIVSAGSMVLGLLMGRERLEEGMDGIFPIVIPEQEMVARLSERLGATSCREISGVDFTDLQQAIQFMSSGENSKCFEHVAEGAEEIAQFLQDLDARGDVFRTSDAGAAEEAAASG